jgi:hypothetical protein
MLLSEPLLGRLHRAGLHMILGQSRAPKDDFNWHADEAVRIYENMYPHHAPTPEQAEGIKELLQDAKAVQAKAREDQASSLTGEEKQQELRRELEQQGQAADEEYHELMYGEPEVDDEDSDDNDEMSDAADEVEADAEVHSEAEDVEMEAEQPVLQPDDAEDSQEDRKEDDQEKTRRPRMSAADRQIIAEGASMAASASGLITPAATRTATGASRR